MFALVAERQERLGKSAQRPVEGPFWRTWSKRLLGDTLNVPGRPGLRR